MDSIKEAIKHKKRPPPPPPKEAGAGDNSRSVAATKKRGLGWPWDQPSEHFQLFFSTDQPGDNPPISPDSAYKVSWIFNWELWCPAGLPNTVEWVPCVRTSGQVGDILPFLTDIQSKGRTITHLLGFNEPEIASQANLSVHEAVGLWKEYVQPAKTQLNLRLGSPGMCSDTSLCVPWLDDFFSSFLKGKSSEKKKDVQDGIAASGVDFLVLHWYGTSVNDMIAFLDKMYKRYQLPIWLNEFACSRMGTGGDESTEIEVTNFLQNAIPWLEQTTWIERYSFFGMAQGQDVGEWVGRQNNFTQIRRDQNTGDTANLSKIGQLYMGM